MWLWSFIVGWLGLSVPFYIFSVYFGWEWIENKLRNVSSTHRRRSQPSQNNNWSFAAGLPRSNTRLNTNSKVRDYLEQLAASVLGGASPDTRPKDKDDSPTLVQQSGKYDKFCQTYHERLTKAIEELGKSLHLRPPILDDDGVYAQPAAETANANFSKLLLEVKEAAMELAPFQDEQPTVISNKSLSDGETVISDKTANLVVSTGQSSPNYEEILSTAILKKVVGDVVGLGGSRKSLSPVISVVDSAVQTDNDGDLSVTGSGKYNVKSWVTTTDGFSNFSDDDISLGTSSSNWSGGDGANPPVVHQIEEHVEITYETNETDSDSSQDEMSPHPPHQQQQQQQRPRKSKKIKQQPVPFPEHGVDIIDSPDEHDQDEPSKKISQVLQWEENWLFKKKKKPIMFSKMAAESVPMLVPNPSISENDVHSGNDEDKSSDLEDNDFVGDYFEFPQETISNKGNDVVVVEKNLEIKWPQDVHLTAGKTARFSITASDAQSGPPSWHSLTNKRILTAEKEKIEMTAEPPKYTLTIVNVQESDAGDYQVILPANNKQSGSEVSRNFRLHVAKAADKRKKSPPTFNSFQDVVRIPREIGPVSVNFELSGHPEPVLNIFKGNDILKTIEDKGYGRWSLVLNRDGSKFAQNIPGEYIAAATNTQGTTRVTFRIEEVEGDEEEPSPPALAIPQQDFRFISVESRAEEEEEEEDEDEDHHNASASSSEAEETMKGTSQSLVTNETVELQEDPNKRFTVAEREKQKWANPIKLEFNPYAPENLAKRIRAGRTSRELVLGAANNNNNNSFEGSEPVEDVFFRTNKHDMKKQSTPEPNIVMINKPLHTIPSDLGGVKLPSVRELAQQFSPVADKNPSELLHPRSVASTQKDVIRGIQNGRDFNVNRSSVEPSRYIPNSASLVSRISRGWKSTGDVTPYTQLAKPPQETQSKWNTTDAIVAVPKKRSSPPAPSLPELPTVLMETAEPQQVLVEVEEPQILVQVSLPKIVDQVQKPKPKPKPRNILEQIEPPVPTQVIPEPPKVFVQDEEPKIILQADEVTATHPEVEESKDPEPIIVLEANMPSAPAKEIVNLAEPEFTEPAVAKTEESTVLVQVEEPKDPEPVIVLDANMPSAPVKEIVTSKELQILEEFTEPAVKIEESSVLVEIDEPQITVEVETVTETHPAVFVEIVEPKDPEPMIVSPVTETVILAEPEFSEEFMEPAVKVDEFELLTEVATSLPQSEQITLTAASKVTGAPCTPPEEVSDEVPTIIPPLPKTPPPKKLESLDYSSLEDASVPYIVINDSFSTIDSMSPAVDDILQDDDGNNGDGGEMLFTEDLVSFNSDSESERDFGTLTPTPSSKCEDSGIEETQDESQSETTPSSTPEAPAMTEEEEREAELARIEEEELRKLRRNIVRGARFRKGGSLPAADPNNSH